jgi:hypothetical protein
MAKLAATSDGDRQLKEMRAPTELVADLAAGSSTVAEVHDDALISTTPRDAP